MKRESGYDIKADVFIESFIKMFNECIYIYDKELYWEIYQGSDVAKKNSENIPLLSNTDEAQWQEDSEAEAIWLKWNLNSSHSLIGPSGERTLFSMIDFSISIIIMRRGGKYVDLLHKILKIVLEA